MANPNPDMSGLKPFKKGDTPNPKGRPKGTKGFPTIFKKCMQSLRRDGTIDYEDGEETYPLIMQLIAIVYSKETKRETKLQAIEKILDRQYGKATQLVEQKIEGVNEVSKIEIVAPTQLEDDADSQA